MPRAGAFRSLTAFGMIKILLLRSVDLSKEAHHDRQNWLQGRRGRLLVHCRSCNRGRIAEEGRSAREGRARYDQHRCCDPREGQKRDQAQLARTLVAPLAGGEVVSGLSDRRLNPTTRRGSRCTLD